MEKENLVDGSIPEELKQNGMVPGKLDNATYVNIRKSPTYHSTALYTLPMGTPVLMQKHSKKQYVKVQYRGVFGYVDRRYISEVSE